MRKEGPQEHNLCSWAPGSFWAIENGSLAGVQGSGGHGRPKSGGEGPRRRGRTGGKASRRLGEPILGSSLGGGGSERGAPRQLEDGGGNIGLRLRQPHTGEAGGQVREAAGAGQRRRRPIATGESAR